MFTLIGQGLIAFSDFSNFFLGENKLHFKKLESERDYRVLQRQFKHADGINLPINYLRQGKSFVCFNSRLEPQGGFALIESGPFRSFEQIPDMGPMPVDASVLELTAVCLSPGNTLRRTRYWSYVVGQTLSAQAKNIIYAVDSDKTNLRERVFNHIRHHVIYEGPVKQLDGMENETVEAVELTNKTQLAKGFFKLALNEISRAGRRVATPVPVRAH
ncbi:MAG: hypothetical protein FJY29_12680 [Betaproteobacteria bacterium]|nr:hypothetical protein [Betaproteobacteria bacterium]